MNIYHPAKCELNIIIAGGVIELEANPTDAETNSVTTAKAQLL